MTEFRSGNKRNSHPYPETPRGVNLQTFARNSAAGPDDDISIIGPTLVPWEAIESSGLAGTDVPITPRSTRILLVTGVITVKNTDVAPMDVQIEVLLDGATVTPPDFENVTVDPVGFEAIPVLTILPLASAVGVTRNISFRLTAETDNNVLIIAESSSLSIQEVPPPSG